MSLNQVLLIGRLGAAPEIKRTASGKVYCTMSLATDRGRPDGEESPPDWHRVKVWDRQAESCAQYLERGRQVAVSGRLSRRSWKDDNDRQQYITEVIAHRVVFLGRSAGRPTPAPGATDGGAPHGPAAEVAADDIPF